MPPTPASPNKGLVIKEAANQLYTADAFSRAVLSEILNRNDVPYQTFANRSDMRRGSTLGNLNNVQVSAHAVDVGAQLTVRSAYEIAGAKNTCLGVEALKVFHQITLQITGADRLHPHKSSVNIRTVSNLRTVMDVRETASRLLGFVC